MLGEFRSMSDVRNSQLCVSKLQLPVT